MFTKIFGSDDDQLLIVRTTDSNQTPTINLSFEAVVTAAGQVGLVCIVFPYPNEEEWRIAFEVFCEDERPLREVVASWRNRLAKQIEKERAELTTRKDLS